MPTSTTLTGDPLAPTERWFLGRYDTELDQVAVFGELSFDVTENFTITAGARWFDYDRKFAQLQEQPEGFTGFSRLDGNQKTSEDGTSRNSTSPTGSTTIGWSMPRTRKGSGSAAATRSSGTRCCRATIKSDELKNYEVGIKTEWLDHRSAIQHVGVLHEVGRLRGAGRRPATGGIPTRLSSTCRRPRSRASRPSSR